MTAVRVGLLGLVLGASVVSGCASPSRALRVANAGQTVNALRDGRFPEAAEQARAVLAKDGGNQDARAVQALTRYKAAGEQVISQSVSFVDDLFHNRHPGSDRMREVLTDFEAALARIDEDLRIAALDRDFSMELCLACWKVDWDHNGRINNFDERLFQIEIDETGGRLADDDPRRKPTFHFDVGDLHWARAMIAFQRALVDGALAYKLSTLSMRFFDDAIWTLVLVHKERIDASRQQLLLALDESDASRVAYLAETDDDREWLPNPKQANHPMPLPVDDKLYQTWADIIGDLRHIIRGEEGIDVAEMGHLVDERANITGIGYLDVAKWFAAPRDIVVNLKELDDHGRAQRHADMARSFFGYALVPTMKKSPIMSRLSRIGDEVKRGQESFDRKLRYLFWLN